MIFGFTTLLRLPSIGAVIEKGGAVWMLGVMLGLLNALRRKDIVQAIVWLAALMVYPVLMVILGGFLSYGSAAIIIVCSILAIASRRYWKVLIVFFAVAFFCVSIFVNYFAGRNTLRDAVWGGASINTRIDVVLDIASKFHFLDFNNYADVNAIDLRLNQNYFIGVAAHRLDHGTVDFLNGQTVLDGVISLVPRALWPEKPVVAGSSDIVRRMTGLNLNADTSWGVGQVMEFYINYAMPGIVVGFVILGFAIGWLDRKAAIALREAEAGKVFLYFLPCVALVQPIGSLVELIGGAGAAFGAAFLWRFAWNSVGASRQRKLEYQKLLMRHSRP